MQSIFDALYAVHPWVPAGFIVLMANGVLSPAIYCALKGRNPELAFLRQQAKAGRGWAKYAYVSLLAFVATALIFLVLLVAALIRK